MGLAERVIGTISINVGGVAVPDDSWLDFHQPVQTRGSLSRSIDDVARKRRCTMPPAIALVHDLEINCHNDRLVTYRFRTIEIFAVDTAIAR